MTYIYILKLQYNKYYIGKTNNPKFRLKQHFNTNGSSWTKKYKPINIHQIIPDCDNFDEDKWTIKFMMKYGINNVRGGTFCQLKLSNEDKNIINKMINSAENKCYKCGENGHFANQCSEKEESEEKEWLCSYCNKGFDTKKGAQYHENVHCKKRKQMKKNTTKIQVWLCDFCGKEFKTKKGATYHENFYCKNKKKYEESDDESDEESDDELTIENLEETFYELDKKDGIYELYKKKYLWWQGSLYEESKDDETPKSMVRSFRLNGRWEYEDYNWRPIKK